MRGMNNPAHIRAVLVDVRRCAGKKGNKLFKLDPMSWGVVLNSSEKGIAPTVENCPNVPLFMVMIKNGVSFIAVKPTNGAKISLLL